MNIDTVLTTVLSEQAIVYDPNAPRAQGPAEYI